MPVYDWGDSEIVVRSRSEGKNRRFWPLTAVGTVALLGTLIVAIALAIILS